MRSCKFQYPKSKETLGAETQASWLMLFGILLPALLCGCSTLNNSVEDHKPYGGVVNDFSAIIGPTVGHGWMPWPLKLYFVLDLPFSLAGDTLMLPFDLYYQHQLKAYQEARRLNPPDPDPLAGWQSKRGIVWPKAITEDYRNYVRALPPDQRKDLIKSVGMEAESVGMVQLFEDPSRAHALQIKVLVYHTSWKHVLIYDQSGTRVKVLKYKDDYLVP